MNTYFYCAKITKYGLFGSSSFIVNGTFSIGTDVNVIEYAKTKVMMDHKSLVNGLSIDIISLNRI